MNILIYIIEGQQYGLELEKIKSAVLAVEITHLPNSPDYILGAINAHGQLIPVVNMRKILGLPERELGTADQFILCEINKMDVALWVDQIKGVKAYPETDLIPAQEVLPNTKNLRYVFKEDDKFVLIYDLENSLETVRG